MIIVSSCLAGINCRYDGKSKPHPDILKMIQEGKAIPVCPEQLGGLATPREPTEIRDNTAITQSGRDVTEEFQKGAEEGLHIALLAKAHFAILKKNSPSCGCGKIYDGSFTGTLTEGDGIFCKLLKKHNIIIQTEDDLTS